MEPTVIRNGDKDASFKIIISYMSWLHIVSNCMISKVNVWYLYYRESKTLNKNNSLI